MSKSVATLGGERRESPPPVAPGDGGGIPFWKKTNWKHAEAESHGNKMAKRKE